MAENPFLDGLARFTHAFTSPWRLFGKPPSEAFLEGLRQRNVLLDALFYDVKVILPDEAAALTPWTAGEGAILVVTPSGGEALRVCADLDDYFAHGGADITTLTVAGVGSSALGTAAFARNVADAVGKPVAAVVSGYGLADLAHEATGGFRWFYGLTSMLDAAAPPVARPRSTGTTAATAQTPEREPGGRDGDVVLALLMDDRAAIDLVVAHSKGNLVVSEALHALQRTDRARSDRLGESIHIVSVSSRIKMPRSCRQVTEVIGGWDRIGDFAMRREAPADVVVPDAWHHTNTDLYGHLPVTKVLKEILETHA